MKLEQQVISLDLSRRLKELGVKQENSFFVWSDHTLPATLWTDEHLKENYTGDYRNVYAAFTVAELGGMLPERYCSYRSGESWFFTLSNGEKLNVGVACDTEADAHAKMLIYLIENRLVDLAAYS